MSSFSHSLRTSARRMFYQACVQRRYRYLQCAGQIVSNAFITNTFSRLSTKSFRNSNLHGQTHPVADQIVANAFITKRFSVQVTQNFAHSLYLTILHDQRCLFPMVKQICVLKFFENSFPTSSIEVANRFTSCQK